MPFNFILMPCKQNRKVEGEIIAKPKIAKLYFSGQRTQREIAENIQRHYNTVNNIIKRCKLFGSEEAFCCLRGAERLSEDKLGLFNFLKSGSKRSKSNKRSLSGPEENLILEKHQKLNYGPKRMFRHLKRQGYDIQNTYALAKIKGVYKRNGLKTKKIRTANGERRALYNYDEIASFEYPQYDVKYIPDKRSLPQEIYQLFKYSPWLPKFQWTIADAKTRTRFPAWSYILNSFFGFKFLEFVICWLRAHNIRVRIHAQIDGGPEMRSGSERKLASWNEKLSQYDAQVYDTDGVQRKQRIGARFARALFRPTPPFLFLNFC